MLAVLAVVEFVAAGLDEKLGETPDIGGVIPLRVGWPASAGSRGRAKWPSLMSICGVLSTRGLRGQDPHAAPSLCLEIFLPRQRRLGYRTTGKHCYRLRALVRGQAKQRFNSLKAMSLG